MSKFVLTGKNYPKFRTLFAKKYTGLKKVHHRRLSGLRLMTLMSAVDGIGGGHHGPSGRRPLKGTFFVTFPYLDQAPQLSISIVIWILSSLFVSSTNSIQIVRRQCCLHLPSPSWSQKHSATILCILIQCNSRAFAVF